MATELETSIRDAAEKVVGYIGDIATLTVETKFVKVGEKGDVDFTQAKPIARTMVKIDGDCDAILPLRTTEAGTLAVDADLLDLHNRNVNTAIDYRARLIDSLIGILKTFAT
jgi:hypothetical protein